MSIWRHKTVTLFLLSTCNIALCQMAPAEAHPQLTVTLVAAFKQPSIVLRISIKNSSRKPLLVNITDRKPPFRVSIMDHSGHDLYQKTYSNRQGYIPGMPGHGLIALRLEPGKSKKYKSLIPAVAVGPGDYEVEVRLATFDFVDGRYEPQLYESNGAEIKIP